MLQTIITILFFALIADILHLGEIFGQDNVNIAMAIVILIVISKSFKKNKK